MKGIGICLWLLIWGGTAQAQLWNELFRQKETALRYSAEQVAALRAYGAVLQKGYAVVQTGLQTIDALKKEDFLQHLAHITGLSEVNPAVKHKVQKTGMNQLLAQTVERSNQALQWVTGEAYLTAGEKRYGRQVYQQLIKRCHDALEELETLLTDKEGAMDDAARLQRIEGLHGEVGQVYHFALHFGVGFRLLAGQRRQAEKEGKVLEKFSQK